MPFSIVRPQSQLALPIISLGCSSTILLYNVRFAGPIIVAANSVCLCQKCIYTTSHMAPEAVVMHLW